MKEQNLEILQEIYSGVDMGQKAMEGYMASLNDENMKNDFQQHLNEYMDIKSQTMKLLSDKGEMPTTNPVGSAILWGSVGMDKLMGLDTSKAAEKMIAGGSMGITNMTKLVNSYPQAEQPVKDLASRLITVEQGHIESMKKYLKH